MNQKTSASDMQRNVSASRDSPQTSVKKPRSEICGDVVAVTDRKGKNLIGSEGVGVADHSNHRPKPVMRNYNPPRESKVKLVSSGESKKLFASQSKRKPLTVTITKKPVMVSNVDRKGKNVIGSGVADHSNHRPKEADSRAGFKDNVGSSVMRNFNPHRGSKVKLLSSEESEKLLASQSSRRHVPVIIQRKPLLDNALMKKKDERRSNQRGLVRVPEGRVNAAFKIQPIQRVEQEPADEDHDDVVAVPEPNGEEGEIRNADYDPTARGKVLEVLRFFKQVYKRLDRAKEERRGEDLFQATSRIDLKTLDVIENMGKKVNVEKRIGSVPGINVGDRFQYKTQLRAVGLHSKPMCGIDYMKVGDMKLATSIVASERNGYKNQFDSGVVVYTGEGGNVISTEGRTYDQKLTKGNLALANSQKEKREVRVIRGEERWDGRGKRYIYFGLYLVDESWSEIEDRGKVVYKFKLCRIPDQPPLTLC